MNIARLLELGYRYEGYPYDAENFVILKHKMPWGRPLIYIQFDTKELARQFRRMILHMPQAVMTTDYSWPCEMHIVPGNH